MQALAKKLKLMKVGDVAVRRNPLFYAEVDSELARLEQADAQARRDWTLSRLAEVLWRASRTAYGREVGGGEHLSSWPLLRKSQVQGKPHRFCSGGSRMFSISASTGGTSGAPLKLARSLRSVVVEQVCMDRLMRKVGVDAREARCAVLRTESIKDPNDFTPPYWAHAAGGDRLVFSSGHLNAATIGAYAKALEEFGPDCLLGYPTSLEALCVLLERTDKKLRIPSVLSSSEVLHPQTWRAAQRQLGCRILDYYGQAERVAFAFATAPGEYRFLPGYGHVELERAGSEDGATLYEIVGTSLWNQSMPLIRYCTGDLIRVPAHWGAAELEEVALGLRSFAGVLGRDGDILLTPEGVKLTGISHFQRGVKHVLRIQVIQESLERVRILVLAAAAYSKRDAEHLMHNVRLKLPSTMEVEISTTVALERTPRGKTPFVIHRPRVKQALQSARAQGGLA